MGNKCSLSIKTITNIVRITVLGTHVPHSNLFGEAFFKFSILDERRRRERLCFFVVLLQPATAADYSLLTFVFEQNK